MRPPAPSSGPPSRPPPSGRPARTRRPPQFWRRHWRGRAEVDEMRGGGGLMCGPSPFSSFPDLVLQSSRGARAPPLLPPSPVRSPPSLPHPPPLCHIRSSSGSPFSLPLSLIAYFCVLVCVSGHAVVVSSQACCVCVCVCVCGGRFVCGGGCMVRALVCENNFLLLPQFALPACSTRRPPPRTTPATPCRSRPATRAAAGRSLSTPPTPCPAPACLPSHALSGRTPLHRTTPPLPPRVPPTTPVRRHFSGMPQPSASWSPSRWRWKR